MTPESELLLQSYDAFNAARGPDAKRLWEIYQSRLDDVMVRNPGISRERMQAMVDELYRRWVKAQQKNTRLPPKA